MSSEQVLKTLLKQARCLLRGEPLQNGRLRYFRRALVMEGFPEIARQVEADLHRDFFSTLQDVELMEETYEPGTGFGLVVCSRLILEFAARRGVFINGDGLNVRSSVFQQCRTLDDVVYLRSLLDFHEEESYLHMCVELDMLDAAKLFVIHSGVTWRDMLLAFLVIEPKLWMQLFLCFSAVLEDKSVEIPRPAATLMLSFASEALTHYDHRGTEGEQAILRLLDLGASPMISMDGHAALLKKLQKDYSFDDFGSGLLDRSISQINTSERRPTALRRFMRVPWSPKFKLQLSHHVCCSLDMNAPCSETFPHKVPSLACLAARYIADSDLATLPHWVQFNVLEHQPPRSK